ncbi:MAG: hypothetical protein U1F30_10445 [Steroidobacteraceae bacterium]
MSPASDYPAGTNDALDDYEHRRTTHDCRGARREASGGNPGRTQLGVRISRGKDVSAHEFLYYFNERVVALRTDRWKFVTHAYYTSSLGLFEKFDGLPGFSAPYDLLFDANGQGW